MPDSETCEETRFEYSMELEVIDYDLDENLTIITKFHLPIYQSSPIPPSMIVESLENGALVAFGVANDDVDGIEAEPVTVNVAGVTVRTNDRNEFCAVIHANLVIVNGLAAMPPSDQSDVQDCLLALGFITTERHVALETGSDGSWGWLVDEMGA